MSAEQNWSRAEKILCIRLDSLGDVLMTTPAMRALKESRPGRNITLMTSASGAAIAPLIPEIDETILYNPPWMKATETPQNSAADHAMIEHLRSLGFDAAVIFTTFTQSPLPAAFLAFLADIPLRLAHCRENPYHLLTHWAPEVDHVGDEKIRHEVTRHLDLVASVGAQTNTDGLSLRVPEKTVADIRVLVKKSGLKLGEPWLVMHPGATAPSRRYPPEYYAEAAQVLCSRHGFQILLTGTTPEMELVERIRSTTDADILSLAGKLNVEQFCALISLAPLLVTNNTGPAHIAAALSTPVVDLYALTNPQHTPWSVHNRVLYHDVPCKFCFKSICPMGHHHCLRLVSPDQVVEAALDLLREAQSARPEQSRKGSPYLHAHGDDR